MANKNFSIQASLYIKNYSGDADYSTYYLNLLNGLDFNKFFNYDSTIRYSRIIDLLQSLPGVEGVKRVLISNGTSNVSKENDKDTFVFDRENSSLNFLSMELPELNPTGIINVDPEEDIFYDFVAYKIGNISDGVFTPLDEFSSLNLSITDFTTVSLDNDELNNSKTIAKQVRDYIKYELETDPTTASYRAYNAPFKNIRDFGVYVIIQDYSFELIITDNGTQDRGDVIPPERYADPIIVAIPVQEENRYILNVKMPMKQLDPVFDGWKTLLSPNEGNTSGHFEIYAPSAEVTIIYDTSGETSENYYVIDSNNSSELTEITNYSRNNDVLSFDWTTQGTGLAVCCATYQNWTILLNNYTRAPGVSVWSDTVTISLTSADDYILWYSVDTSGLDSVSSNGYFIAKATESFNTSASQGLKGEVSSVEENSVTINLNFLSADNMAREVRYKVIPAVSFS